MSERSALRSYLAILGVSAAVVGIATGFAAGIGKKQVLSLAVKSVCLSITAARDAP